MRKTLIIAFVCLFIKVEAQTSTFKTIDSLLQFGRYKKALLILENKPHSFLKYKKTAFIYDAIDEVKKATKYYEKALQFKDDYTVKTKLATAYKKQKSLQKAIVIFEEIVKKDTGNLLIKYNLGKLYLQTQQPKKAKEILQNLIKKDPKNANYSYQLGLVYLQLKKRNLKINNFLSAYKKDSTHFKSIEKLARSFTKLRFRDSALIFIDKGLQINPNHISLNKLKINDLYRKKKFKKAIEKLLHIDSLQKNEHYTQVMLGKSYFSLKDYENAKMYFFKASKLDYEDFKSHTYLGDIFLLENNLKGAEFNYAIATIKGKKPRDKEFLGLAKVYEKKMLPKQVLESYKKAVAENSKNNEALYLLAKQSDNYYKDKKIGYKLYTKYLNYFKGKDVTIDSFVSNRIKNIKKDFFLKGQTLE